MTAGNETDGGYVHDPSAFDEDDRSDGGESGRSDGDASGDWLSDPIHPKAADREFGRRGWVLVGVIVFAFVLCPLAILLVPPETDYLFALLILPLAPAVVLAITAVWATTRP